MGVYVVKTQKEIKAVQESIRHWQDDCLRVYMKWWNSKNKERLLLTWEFPTMGSATCSLCKVFYDYDDLRGVCASCPLYKAGQRCVPYKLGEERSVYNLWCEATYKARKNIHTQRRDSYMKKAITATENMINTMKELLPKKNRRGRYA